MRVDERSSHVKHDFNTGSHRVLSTHPPMITRYRLSLGIDQARMDEYRTFSLVEGGLR